MDREKLTEEILGYLDGQLTAEEERALAARIRGDAEAEKLLADLMRLHASVASALQERAGESAARLELGAAPTPPGGVPRVRRRLRAHRPERRTAWVAGIVAALAACLLIAIAVSVPGRKVPDRPTAIRPSPKPETPAPAPPETPREVPRPKPPPPPEEPKAPPLPIVEPAPVPRPTPPPAPRPEEPRPAPTPAPAPPKTTTVAEAPPKPPPALAQVERVKGDATVAAAPAREAQGLLPGQSLKTLGAESLAVVKFVDGTQLELGGDTTLTPLAEATSKAGKTVVLESGAVVAKVSKQPAGQAMLFTTPHAEARVLGTTLRLSVDPQGTRLEVTEGRVRLTRRQDGASVEVGAGFYAVAAPGPRPAARKIGTPLPGTVHLLETFEDAAAVKARWQPIEGGFPTTSAGGLEIDLSPRPGESYAAGGWHVAGGLRTRTSFPLPLRVTVDVEVSHQDAALNALLVLIPASQKGGTIKNEIAVRVRGGEHALLIENEKVKITEGSLKVPLRERWTLEVTETDVRVLVDDREFHRQAHKLTIAEPYRVELQGAAKVEAPKGAKVRFDNLKIEP